MMRTYVKPTLECIEIRAEERMAGSCTVSGNCVGPDGNTVEFVTLNV